MCAEIFILICSGANTTGHCDAPEAQAGETQDGASERKEQFLISRRRWLVVGLYIGARRLRMRDRTSREVFTQKASSRKEETVKKG